MMNVVRLSLFATLLVAQAQAFPQGASPEACNDLIPQHGANTRVLSAEAVSNLFAMEVPTAVAPGQMVNFRLLGSSNFNGFMVRVLNLQTGMGAGQFFRDPSGTSTPMRCSAEADTATHNGRLNGNVAVLHWRAPEQPGTYGVMGTIVPYYNTTITGFKSPIHVMNQAFR